MKSSLCCVTNLFINELIFCDFSGMFISCFHITRLNSDFSQHWLKIFESLCWSASRNTLLDYSLSSYLLLLAFTILQYTLSWACDELRIQTITTPNRCYEILDGWSEEYWIISVWMKCSWQKKLFANLKLS